MLWNRDLTGPSLDIAGDNSRSIRVMAGPGTGKSYSLTKRVIRLLEEEVEPDKIWAVTFTRNAAKSLINDLHSIQLPGSERINATTLHGYCFALLNKEDVFRILNRHARPLISFSKAGSLQFEAAPMLEDIRDPSFGDKRKMCKRLRAFEAAWARLQNETPGWPVDPIDHLFNQLLSKWLRFHKGMLIGELIPLAYLYLKNNPTTEELEKYSFILVDEYQDLNKAEQSIIEFFRPSSSIIIVGDINQSIYSFRFAHPDGIIEYSKNVPGTKDKTLSECRRCPKKVVSIADSLINYNYDTKSVRLVQRSQNIDGEIRIVQWNTVDEEVNNVVQYCKHLIDNEIYKPEDILILCPRRLIGYMIKEKLNEYEIKNHSYYHEEILNEKETQVNFTLLNLLADPEDRVALRFWLGYGNATWNAAEYKKLMEYCQDRNLSPFMALTEIKSQNTVKSEYKKLLVKFDILLEHINNYATLNGRELFDILFPENEKWSETIREACSDYIIPETTAKDIIEQVRTLVTQPETPEGGDFVKIMSLHKSKGLSSKVVIITSTIEGIIPTIDDDEDIEKQEKEQRRLFYVALTRATETLIISSFRNINTRLSKQTGANTSGSGQFRKTLNSRFISELGISAPQIIKGNDWVSSSFN